MQPSAEPAPYEVEVEVDASDVADPTRESAAVTIIPVDDRLPPGADVGTALAGVPGAVVRRLGGLGAFTSVAIRGSTARQVEVQLDGLTLNPDGGSAVDLAELPLWAFDRVEVWRSDPPPEHGIGGIGGVVDLVTGRSHGASSTIQGGSYGTGASRALWAGPAGLIAVDAFATTGDFTYFSDKGTVYATSDDELLDRVNADKRRVSAIATARGGNAVEWRALTSVLGREEGVPGFTWGRTEEVRYAAFRDLTAFELTGTRGAARWTGRAWGLGRLETFEDPAAEIGVGPQDLTTRTGSLGARGSVRAVPSDVLSWTAVGEYRSDAWSATNELSGVTEPARVRHIGRAAAGAGLNAGAWTVTPTVWALLLGDAGATTFTVLPRLGGRRAIGEDAAVKANIGRYVRPPDVDELFGDRGAVVGNPDLVPEDAWQADLGAVYAVSRVSLELTGWWTEARDHIVYVDNAQQITRPVNLAAATIRGVELGGTTSTHGVDARLAATATDSRDRGTGNPLPRTPAWSVESTVSARRGPAQLGWTGSFTAGNALDAAGIQRAEPRLFQGAFARLTSGEWSFHADVRNLTNRITEVGPRDPLVDDGEVATRAVTDFTGYPLPGRTFLLGVTWTRAD